MHSTRKTLSCYDLEAKSKQSLDADVFDYISGGSGSEWGLNNNLRSFEQYQIVPRILQGIASVDISCMILQTELSNPLIIAPMAFHKLACAEGEYATAKAATQTNTIFTLSTMSSVSIEDISKESSSSKWFQLYPFKNQSITTALIKRAEAAGYKAIIITVDVPVMGYRLRDIRNNFSLPKHISAANLSSLNSTHCLSDKSDGSMVKDYTDQEFQDNLSWEDISRIKNITTLPIILKGVLNAEDAQDAIRAGVSAIIVSNHGGRQLDSVISPLDALIEIKESVGDKIPVILDGGIRNGEDIFKAVALGADAVMLGRPVLWALSVGGKDELVSLLDRLKNELIHTMKLAGCNSLKVVHERGLSLLAGEKITALKLKKLISSIPNKELTSMMENSRHMRIF